MPRQLEEEHVAAFEVHGHLGHNFNGKTFQVMEHASGGPQPTNCCYIPETVMANAEGLRITAVAFWRGCPEEGMAVARCFYDVIFEHLQREWNQPMLIDKDRNPIFGNHYQSVPAAWHLLLGLEG